MRKRMLFVLSLLLFFTFLPIGPAGAQDPYPLIEEQTIEVGTSDVDEDTDWVTVRIEESEYTDPVTGEFHFHRMVVQESPPVYHPALDQCDELGLIAQPDGTFATAAGCRYVSAVRVLDTDSRGDAGGGVTSKVQHFAYKYCRDANCYDVYYQPYKLQVWWVRTHSIWAVRNVTVRWGCRICLICGGGEWDWVYSRGPFTPVWLRDNPNRSATYEYSGVTGWKPLQNYSFGVPLSGTADSDIYKNGAYFGHTFAQAGFGVY